MTWNTAFKGSRVVVLGIMGRTPFAGVTWQVLHYLEGFRQSGYDVYYVEDTGDWPYDADQNSITDDCTYTVKYIARYMQWCGMEERWAYCAGVDGRTYGPLASCLEELWQGTDILVNLTGATMLREEHHAVPVRIYLETDPVLPQIEVAQGRAFTIDLLSAHTHHFSYGENLGAPDCGVPLSQFVYQPTRPPVVLEWWASVESPPQDAGFTTIGSWRQSGKDIQWNGEMYYWSKHLEFMKFIDLPRLVDAPFELALACDDKDTICLLETYGWRVRDAITLTKDPSPYRAYISASRGEFTVAKDQNVRLRSGWFSDRSACYLAAGKPVITQDTGFGNHVPTGLGLFSFVSMADVTSAIERIQGQYDRHSKAAREIAAEYFSAGKVIDDLMTAVSAQARAERG